MDLGGGYYIGTNGALQASGISAQPYSGGKSGISAQPMVYTGGNAGIQVQPMHFKEGHNYMPNNGYQQANYSGAGMFQNGAA